MEVIVFPDAEAVAVGWLTGDLAEFGASCPVSATIPNPRPPGAFVTVQRTGGPRRDLVTDKAQLTFDSYAAKASEACELANLVRGIVAAWRGRSEGGTTAYRIEEFAGPQMLPDPVSKQARYRFTAIVHMRGSAITGGI